MPIRKMAVLRRALGFMVVVLIEWIQSSIHYADGFCVYFVFRRHEDKKRPSERLFGTDCLLAVSGTGIMPAQTTEILRPAAAWAFKSFGGLLPNEAVFYAFRRTALFEHAVFSDAVTVAADTAVPYM